MRKGKIFNSYSGERGKLFSFKSGTFKNFEREK